MSPISTFEILSSILTSPLDHAKLVNRPDPSKGKTETVLLRGKVAISNNECHLKPGDGKFISRGKSSMVI